MNKKIIVEIAVEDIISVLVKQLVDKAVFITIALSFCSILGAIGGMDCGTMSVGEGIIYMILSTALYSTICAVVVNKFDKGE